MNLLLLTEEDLLGADEAFIAGYRAQHLEQVLSVRPGTLLKAGVLGGLMGEAEVLSIEKTGYRLRLCCNQPPPEPLPLILIMALPRPKMLRRLLQMVAGLGVKHIYLLHSYRVEKSYWSSPWLQEQAIR
ncbi:MAG: 16S rRNA (uracil(1498)-N(3))-methyltransferase, partial [Pseudomonadales bacterium]|nr:16S rRNA (uracil(1498)-N(3))-methyltransferase [Pseudomonadales bacterium]